MTILCTKTIDIKRDCRWSCCKT